MADDSVHDAEQWRQIPGFPDYEVSTIGRIRRPRRGYGRGQAGLVLRAFLAQGYPSYDLRAPDGKVCRLGAHRAVGLTFLPPPPTPEHAQVAHWDGDRANPRLENLRWATPQENSDDRIRHGTVNRGSRNGRSKLTEPQVSAIKRRLEAGHRPADIAADYGVCTRSIRWILSGKKWRHVP